MDPLKQDAPPEKSSARSAGARLLGLGQFSPGQYPIAAGRTSIGSAAGNDIILKLATVSRRHAIIYRRFGRYWIEDCHSTNGVFVNGRRISGAIRLQSGDELRFGDSRFVFLRPRASSVVGARALSFMAAIEIFGLLIVIGFLAATWYSSRGGNWRALISGHHQQSTIKAAREGEKTRAAAPGVTTERDSGLGGPEPEWLARLNHYRSIAGLSPVSDDPALNAGDRAHARYLVANYADRIRDGAGLGMLMHEEDAGAPGYSAAGLSAAKASAVIEGFAPKKSDAFAGAEAIDVWIAGPFHRLPIISPLLKSAGYGYYCADHVCAAALNVLTNVDRSGAYPKMFDKPIEFPPGGATIALKSSADEWPSPISGCPGYPKPYGLPITLELGIGLTPKMTAYSITQDGAPVEACGFDASDYSNENSATQRLGREILNRYGAMVVVPRAPLESGKRYLVAITADSHAYQWSFSVR